MLVLLVEVFPKPHNRLNGAWKHDNQTKHSQDNTHFSVNQTAECGDPTRYFLKFVSIQQIGASVKPASRKSPYFNSNS